MFMPLYEFLIDPLGLPVEWYWEYIILFILDKIAYLVAYNAVRDLYDTGMNGRALGSFVHCVIRAIFFATVWAITYGAIWVCQWMFAHWVLVVSILGASIVIVALIILIIRHIKKREEGKDLNERNEEQRN